MRREIFAAVSAAIVVLATASGALAQETADDERARLHFNSGRSYFEEGNYEQALEEFSRAYDLSHRDVLLVNIANCQERLGRWREAADSLDRFMASLPPADEQRPTMQRRIDNLRHRAAEHEAQTTTTQTTQTTTADPTATTTTTTTATTTTTEPASDGLLVPAIIAYGVGGASLIAFGVLGGLALSEESAVASGCGATRSCTAAQVSAMDDLALGADIALAIGIAGVATGTVLILVAPPHGATERATVRATPVISPRAAGLAISGSF